MTGSKRAANNRSEARLSVEYRSPSELKGYDKNSRTHSEEQVEQIAKSITEFGFTNPILVDDDGVIIAGHGRLEAAMTLNLPEVPTIVLSGLTDTQRRAYVIADNRLPLNAGWNEKLLMRELIELEREAFDLDLLGFDDKELNDLLGTDDDSTDEVEGQIKFSEELGEAHNYVVLYFDNDIDWLSARTHFNLDSVHSKRSNGKPWSKGIGRVINGADYLAGLKSEH